MSHLAEVIEAYFDRLWPICRSIMGPAIRESMDILDDLMPTKRLVYKTGSKVLDWTVPNEWEAKEAYIIGPDGDVIVDFKNHNLHLVSHSMSVDMTLSLDALDKHLHSLPDQPDTIPYVTSYYNENWGFCLPHSQRQKLKEGDYKVFIDTYLGPGELVIGEATLGNQADNAAEVLFSSYLCHPSMANNELSGPLVLCAFYAELAKRETSLKHRYRFFIYPETIGSIALLDRYGDELKRNLIAGYHLSCIGDGGSLTLKRSRRGLSLADKVGYYVLRDNGLGQVVDFNPAFGSDDRQYCSSGFDLPIASIVRTMYTEYPEYHTSDDNKALMDFDGMAHSVAMLLKIVDALEAGESKGFRKLKALQPKGEPQLGPRGLFRSLSVKKRDDQELAMWWLLNYCDGAHDLYAIALLSKMPLDILSATADILVAHDLLSEG